LTRRQNPGIGEKTEEAGHGSERPSYSQFARKSLISSALPHYKMPSEGGFFEFHLQPGRSIKPLSVPGFVGRRSGITEGFAASTHRSRRFPEAEPGFGRG
jgi:hypothetical protein